MDFKVFIASSLRLSDDRNAVTKAVAQLNDEQCESELSFSVFDYVHDDTIVQQLENGDAQDAIRPYLYQSMVFVMIVRGRIGKLTLDEFSNAVMSRRNGGFPQHIFIYYDQDHSRDDVNDENSISFPEFEKEYLSKTKVDELAYKLIEHKAAYYIPFGEGYNPLEVQVYENIRNLLNSGNMPLTGALQPWAVGKQEFYGHAACQDANRLEQCHEDIYFRREVDEDLQDQLKKRQGLIIHGSTLCGKTRAAMNLISGLDDGWIVFFPSAAHQNREAKTLSMMKALIDYCNNYPNHPKHYVFIDDIHQLAFESDDAKVQQDIENTLTLFRNLVTNEENRIKLIATSTDSETFLGTDKGLAYVGMKEMNKAEFEHAVEFFHHYDLRTENKQALTYRAIGAILLDMESFRTYYIKFCNVKNEVTKAVRTSLLKAIKATSIWKRRRIGEVETLRKMAYYFVSQTEAVEKLDEEQAEDVIYKKIDAAIDALVEARSSGITKVQDGLLLIQEYIYDYVLAADGSVLKPGCTVTEKEEQELVTEILKYCFSEKLYLTEQAAKLASRSHHRGHISQWIYSVFTDTNTEKRKAWEKVLLAEKEAVENGEEKDWKRCHFYCRIYGNAITHINSFEEAVAIYNDAVLSTPYLISTLLKTIKKMEDLDKARQLPDYKMFVEKYPNMEVLARLVSLRILNLEQSLPFFEMMCKEFRYQPREVAAMRKNRLENPLYVIPDEEIPMSLAAWFMCIALDAMTWKVSSPQEWSMMKEKLKEYYYLKMNSIEQLGAIANGTNEGNLRSKLTDIELFSFTPTTWLEKHAIYVWPGKIDKAEKYLKDEILGRFAQVLENGVITEQQTISTASYVVNILIKNYPNDTFRIRLQKLFKPAFDFTHPVTRDRLILTNCYAYQHMILFQQNSFVTAANVKTLLFDYLVKHLADPNNPIRINSEILCTMMTAIAHDQKLDIDGRIKTLTQIKKVFNTAHVRKNKVAYNILIDSSDSLEEAMKYLQEMRKSHEEPDIYTALNLCKFCSSLSKKLGFVKLPFTLPENFGVTTLIPELNDTVRTKLLTEEKFVIGLYKCSVSTAEERKVLDDLLAWLRTEKPELLKNCKIYQMAIQNIHYLTDIDKVWTMVEDIRQSGYPNTLVLSALIYRIGRMKNKGYAMERLNTLLEDMLKEGRWNVHNVACMRVKLYSNFREQLPMLIWEKDENDAFSLSISQMNLLKYLRTIQQELSAANSFEKETITSRLQRLEDYDSNEELVKPIISIESNVSEVQKLIDSMKAGQITVEQAVGALNWESFATWGAAEATNRILNEWNMVAHQEPDAFNRVKAIYVQYLRETPLSQLFATMMKFTRSYDDVLNVYELFDQAKSIQPLLTLEPHILTSQYRLARSFDDLRKYIDAFEDRKGVVEQMHLATMIPYLVKIAEYDDDTTNRDANTECEQILDDLCRFFFQKGGENNMLRKPLNILKRENVRSDILIKLMEYQNKREFLPIKRSEVLATIKECYLPIFLNDFNNQAKSNWIRLGLHKTAPDVTFSILKDMLLDTRLTPPVNVTTPIMQAAVMGATGLADYTELMLAFRNAGCCNINDVTEPFLRKYRRRYWKLNNDEEMLVMRRVYSRIVVLSKINVLRYKDYMPDHVDLGESKPWDNDRQDVYHIVNEGTKDADGNKMSLNELLYQAVQNLPHPYFLAMKCLYLHERKRLIIEKNSKEAWLMHNWEKECAALIRHREIPFEKVKTLAVEWIRSGWCPEIGILAEIYMMYKTVSEDTDDANAQEALTFYNGLKHSMTAAKGKDCLILYFHDLGYINDEALQKRFIKLQSKDTAFFFNRISRDKSTPKNHKHPKYHNQTTKQPNHKTTK